MGWNFQNDLPIYTQLVDAIKFSIVSGELLPGARMSTVRDLALEAGVNPNTMQRALQELEREGLVFSQRSSGRFVPADVEHLNCPSCGGHKLTPLTGRDLTLKEILIP